MADIITPGGSDAPRSTMVLDAGEIPKGNEDINQAVKSFEKRDFDACIKQLAKAVKANPELPPAHALFAKLAFLGNQGPLIRPALERAVQEDREHPDVYILFANLALVENRATDAAVHLEKAAALSTSKRWNAEQRKRIERICHQGNAVLAESRSDWEAARSELSAWLALEPTNARVRRRLGIALFSLDKKEQATKELQQASKEDSSLEPAPLTLGWLYTRDRDLKRAEEWMLYAVKVAPDSLAVRMGVTSWMIEQGRSDEAKVQAEAAIKIDPKSNEVKRALGLIARQKKDYARAEAIFQELSQESPSDAWPRNQLALVLVEQDDEAKKRRAIELAELSVRQDSKAPDSLTTLATTYYRTKRVDDAEKILQSVMNSGKANSDAVYMMAQIQAGKGSNEAAQTLLKSALAAPGLFLNRSDAQKLLDRIPKASK